MDAHKTAPTLAPASRSAPDTAVSPRYYVPLPKGLVSELRVTPLVIGVYALVARVFRATRAPVALSAADLRRYDPALSTGAGTRALSQLCEKGYLEKVPSGGRRNAYVPAWGHVGGAPRRWELQLPCLGRPPHIPMVRLPQELLDRYLGRLEPHARHGAHVTRYTTAPLLTLADVGRYALGLCDFPFDEGGLESLGLAAGGRLLPVPSAGFTLALVSQRRLFDAGSPITLTPAGWALIGLTPPPVAAPTGAPLFFMPGVVIGHPIAPPIAPLIADSSPTEGQDSASRSTEKLAAESAAGSHGIPRTEGIEESTPQPPHTDDGCVGGGRSLTRGGPDKTTGAGASSAASEITGQSLSESARELLRLGVRAEVARSLADRPLDQVRQVIAQARARAGVRDCAAWVVSALRALPAEVEQAAPAPRVSDLAILTHPGLSNAERTRWLHRFRAADPADRPAVLARFHAEHPAGEAEQGATEPCAPAAAAPPASPVEAPGEQGVSGPGRADELSAPAAAPGEHAERSDGEASAGPEGTTESETATGEGGRESGAWAGVLPGSYCCPHHMQPACHSHRSKEPSPSGGLVEAFRSALAARQAGRPDPEPVAQGRPNRRR